MSQSPLRSAVVSNACRGNSLNIYPHTVASPGDVKTAETPAVGMTTPLPTAFVSAGVYNPLDDG